MREIYLNKIAKLREERKLSRERFNDISIEIENILNTFAVDFGSTMIDSKELSSLDINEIYYVNNKVRFKKISEDDKTIVFKTYVDKGGEFGLQNHDIIETVYIEEGNLIEECRNDKIYNKGEFVIYQKKELHKPKSNMDSVYLVTFKKRIKDEDI